MSRGNNAQEYAQKAEIAVARQCGEVAPAHFDQCKDRVAEPYREAERSEQDLQAQEGMAIWTEAMGVAAIVGMAVGVFGLALIFFTFQETRRAAEAGFEANKIARDGIEAQVRPWLKISIEEAIGFRLTNGSPHFHARIKVENVGQSPARNVAYFASMVFGDRVEDDIKETLAMYADGRLNWRDPNLFPGADVTRRVSCEHNGAKPEGPVKVSYYVVAMYRTTLSDEPRSTADIYEVTDLRRDDGLIDFKSPPYGENLHLTPHDSGGDVN